MNITRQYLDFRFRALKEALSNPHDHQRSALTEVVKSFHNTQYAYELGHRSNMSETEFLSSVPLCRYDDIEPFIEQMRNGKKNVLVRDKIKYFGESSGTTGRNKTIPLSKRYLKDCLIKGSIYTGSIVNHHVRDAAEGKMIVLPGSLKELGDCLVGDVSAIMADHIPLILRHKSAYNAFSNLNSTWESKLRSIVESIRENNRIIGISGLPTWNLKLLDYVKESGIIENCDQFFKGIKFFVHGGVSIEPYKERYSNIFPNNDVVYINVYNSTEGYFAFQDDPEDDNMSLFVDGNIYYEFIPLDEINNEQPNILNLSQVEKERPYVLVISNISGLYRYVVEDVVEFGSLNPYKLRIIGRTSGFLNVFGEEVMEDMCNKVIDRIVKKIGTEVNDYTIAPKVFNKSASNGIGCHEWLIEFNGDIAYSEKAIASLIDEYLKEQSHDYTEKRKHDLIMRAPTVKFLQKGSFYKYLDLNQKIGVQSKIPRISRSRDLLNQLYALT